MPSTISYILYIGYRISYIFYTLSSMTQLWKNSRKLHSSPSIWGTRKWERHIYCVFFCTPSLQFSSIKSLICVRLCNKMDCSMPGFPVHHQLLELAETHVHLWCHSTISSSFVSFSSCLQSVPASGSFPMSQLFASGGQRIGILASVSVLPMNIQDWFPLGLTVWISL